MDTRKDWQGEEEKRDEENEEPFRSCCPEMVGQREMLAMPAFVTFPRFPAYENPSPLDINFSNRWAGFDSDLG